MRCFGYRLNMTRFHVIASVSVAIDRVGIPRRLIAALAPLARNDKSPHFVILKPLAAEESQNAKIMRCFGYRLNMTRFHVI
ncbi:MAG: hypothetical protein K2F85_08585, partial [Helicobacter sp.]|nr:hypothetical protein [Helicobacter sp.]